MPVNHFRSFALAGALAVTHFAAPLARAQQPGGGAPVTAEARAARTMVQPGDRVVVKVFREPELSDTVTVDVDGGLSLPRLGTIPAARLTMTALHDTLRARYAGFLRNPAFELQVLRRVIVNGAVSKPGVYYVDVASTVRDAVAIAGGVSDQGDPNRVVVIRDGQRVRLRGGESASAELYSGDQLLVERRSWLSRNALALTGTATAVASVVVSILVVTR